MRILFVVVILVSVIISVQAAYAESGFQFDQAAISAKYKSDLGTETFLSSKVEGNWSWLLFHAGSRICLQSPQDNYSCLLTEYQFPHITPDLTLYLSDQWNQSYNVYAALASYQWELLDKLELEYAVGNKIRNSLKESSQEYQYYQDLQWISLDYSFHGWTYWIKLLHNQKNYPDYSYYTSEKIRLEQKFGWKSDDIKISLRCNEETGQYPYDQPEAEQDRNYWKQQWILDGQKDFNKQFQVKWQYSDNYYIKGFIDPYQTGQKLKLKGIYKPNSKLSYSLQAKFAQLFYASPSPVEYEPGVIPNDEEDYESRTEQIINLTGKYSFDTITVEISGYYGQFDYSQKKSMINSSLFCTLEWKLGKNQEYTSLLKIAPGGDGQSRKGYYQLKLIYKPKKQTRESKLGDLDKIYEQTEEEKDETTTDEEKVSQFIEF